MQKTSVGLTAVVLLFAANLMAQVVKVPNGTPIRLQLAETLLCENSHAGDSVAFEVMDDVKIDGITVIRKNALAYGRIDEGTTWARRMWKGGKIFLDLKYVVDVTGRQIPIVEDRYIQARGRGTELTLAMVSAPSPLWLLWEGKHTKLPNGKTFVVVTKGEMDVDLTQLALNTANPAATPTKTSLPLNSSMSQQQQVAYSKPPSIYIINSKGALVPSR
jgi:hypothetical protein